MLVFLEIINKIGNSVDYVLTYSYTHKNQRKRSTANKRATINAILVYEYLWLIQRPWTLCSLVKFMYCCFIYFFFCLLFIVIIFPSRTKRKKRPANEPQLFMISMVLEILNLNVSKERLRVRVSVSFEYVHENEPTMQIEYSRWLLLCNPFWELWLLAYDFVIGKLEVKLI